MKANVNVSVLVTAQTNALVPTVIANVKIRLATTAVLVQSATLTSVIAVKYAVYAKLAKSVTPI